MAKSPKHISRKKRISTQSTKSPIQSAQKTKKHPNPQTISEPKGWKLFVAILVLLIGGFSIGAGIGIYENAQRSRTISSPVAREIEDGQSVSETPQNFNQLPQETVSEIDLFAPEPQKIAPDSIMQKNEELSADITFGESKVAPEATEYNDGKYTIYRNPDGSLVIVPE